MPLSRQFDEDLKGAMKASDRARVSVLRLVKAAVKNRQIDQGRELTDEEITGVLSTLVKQRRESVEQYTKAGRTDLARSEEEEIAIIQTYMPRQLSPEELDMIIRGAILEAGAKGAADLGKVMKVLMPKVRGVADGKYVNERVKALIGA